MLMGFCSKSACRCGPLVGSPSTDMALDGSTKSQTSGIEQFGSRDGALAAETKAIQTEKPLYNKKAASGCG
jgi:hypothetical protein